MFARTLESVAWRYIIDLRMIEPARQLVDRAAPIISASEGENSDAMSSIEDIRLRLAQLTGDSQAVAERKDRVQAIYVAVHGPNTKRMTIP